MAQLGADNLDKPPSPSLAKKVQTIFSSKKIKDIYISNVLEGFYRSYQSLPAKKRLFWTRYDSAEGNRALFYNDDRKVIITSYPINPEHLKNTCKLMGWNNVYNITPKRPSPSISEDIIGDKILKAELEQLINKNPQVALIPYRATPEFYHLISYLRKKGLQYTTPETVAPEQEFVTTYSHCKRGFRHLWCKAFPSNSQLKIAIPQGFITGNRDEAIEAAWWFQQQKRSFMIKYNKGTQGIGILINYTSKLPYNKKDFRISLKNLLTDKIWNEPCIIVEELIEIDKTKLGGSPSIEFFINSKGVVMPSYASEQILGEDKKTFRGIYIHPELIFHKHLITAFKAGAYFGRELANLGYRGYFDIDLVISKEDKIYAVESNLRRTGGTHIHEAACSLLGKNYLKSFHLIGEDIMLDQNSNLNYDQCLDLLKNFEFIRQTKTGYLFCNPDMLSVNIFNAIFIEKSASKLFALRRKIISSLAKLTKKTHEKANK